MTSKNPKLTGKVHEGMCIACGELSTDIYWKKHPLSKKKSQYIWMYYCTKHNPNLKKNGKN
jgi:hypothetical protein